MRITSIIRNYRGTKGTWVSFGKSKKAIPVATEELFQSACTYWGLGIEVEPQYNEKKQIIGWLKGKDDAEK